jgi:hypothetical protein
MPNESTADAVRRTQFTVEEQLRLEALQFATALVTTEINANRYAPDPDGTDHGSRSAHVLATAQAYHEFLTRGGDKKEEIA